MDKDTELKSALEELHARFGIKGYLDLYIEGDRIKGIVNISWSALTPILPMILEYMAKRKG